MNNGYFDSSYYRRMAYICRTVNEFSGPINWRAVSYGYRKLASKAENNG